MADRSKKTKKRFPLFAVLLIVFACGVFAYSAYRLIDFYRADEEAVQQAQELYDLAVTTVPPNADGVTQQTDAAEGTDEATQTADAAPYPTGGADYTHVPKPSLAPGETEQPTQAAQTEGHGGEASTQQAAQPTAESGGANNPPAAGPLYVDFSKLQQINPDICGWLYSPGTVINYPVVFSSDNVYYLDHLVDGTHSAAGSLFVDYRNNRDFSDLNTVIYGHHMKSGTMFGSLKLYKNASYYKNHPYMWLYTPTAVYRLDIIAGYTTRGGSSAFSMYNDAGSLAQYIASAVQQSAFTSQVDISSVTKVVTLATCAYDFTNARYVLLCHPVQVG